MVKRRTGEEENFSWRGEEVSRIEGLSDAVFAFSVTLLVVSLEVPDSFDELLATMRGFFAFAICFALLLAVWHEHYKFFRRYGLADNLTIALNSALLFIVLVYVYPLKFLFALLVDQTLGFDSEEIRTEQVPLLMVIYGAGFVAVQSVLALFYVRAYALREQLELDAHERSITREEVRGFLLNTGVGLASISIALLGGVPALSWAGFVYCLVFPLQILNSRLANARREKSKG
ncbi:MAG TPA: TMEM175 family protein [Rubrobacteraceae bacterium]|nr:TMEM175 family protein [Rubrobacteraceae bacterium]